MTASTGLGRRISHMSLHTSIACTPRANSFRRASWSISLDMSDAVTCSPLAASSAVSEPVPQAHSHTLFGAHPQRVISAR